MTAEHVSMNDINTHLRECCHSHTLWYCDDGDDDD
jgi:hypothetical protein